MKRSVAIMVGAFASLTILVLLLWTAITRYDLNAELEAWKLIGGVTNPADLLKRMPDGENAAVIYGQVYDGLIGIRSDAADILTDPTAPSADLDALMEKAGPLIDLLGEAASIERCIWKHGSATGIDTLTSDNSYLAQARLLALFLAADGAVAHRDGRYEHAMDSIRRMFKLADHVVAVSGVHQLLTSIAIDHVAFRLLEELFRDQVVPGPVASARERRYRARLRRALLADGARGLSVFDDPSFLPATRIFLARSFDRDKAFFVRSMRVAIDAIETPYYERRTPSDRETPRWARISNVLIPYMEGLHRCIAGAETRLLLFESAMELREYRRHNGEYPAEWATPNDPLTGRPLHFERVRCGFVIRSEAAAESPESSNLQWQWN